MKRLNKNEALDYLAKYHDVTQKYYQDKAKHSYFFAFDDGKVIEFSRPPISKTLYYDDEYEEPSTKLDGFIDYNLNDNFRPRYSIERWLEDERSLEKFGCCVGGHSRKMWIANFYGKDSDIYDLQTRIPQECQAPNKLEDYQYFVRYLTDEEQSEVINAYWSMEEDYKKRLVSYYKRYGEKVTTSGYWANR